jgi:ergothioneine biosynthesis protein EgtB
MTAVGTDTLRERLEAAWTRSDALFELLPPAAWYERPIALRQPFIFYVGHLPAFAWNQVVRGVLERPGFRPAFDELFARGIDPVGVDRYQPDRPEVWPRPAEVLDYRDRIRDVLRAAFDDVAAREGDVLADRGRVWHLVIEHELMHHETLLYMMHQLPRGVLRRTAGLPPYRPGEVLTTGRVAVPAGPVTLGAEFADREFGWDNEFPRLDVDVAAFDVDRYPVTNGEWLEFVAAGGYEREALWDADGFAWRTRAQHDHPVFWRRKGYTWHYLTLFDELPLSQVAGWPVYVSWAEARAYTRWRGGDLMTEPEFHRAALGAPWGDAAASNIDFTNWAPVPAGSLPGGASRFDVLGLIGNGWEWTSSRFAPFPGFAPWARTYPGYSADFFDGRHYVMLGGSWATDRALVRPTFRNWFQPHYPYVFAKFRCVYR